MMENFQASPAPVTDSEEQDGRGYDGGMEEEGGSGKRERAKDKGRKVAEGRTAAEESDKFPADSCLQAIPGAARSAARHPLSHFLLFINRSPSFCR